MKNHDDISKVNAGQESEVLSELAREFANPAIGEEFFSSLAEFLARTLGAEFVTIGVLTEDGASVRTVVYLAHGAIMPNIVYSLAGTPCETIINKKFCAYSGNVQETFPDDAYLAEEGVQSYIGYPLCSSKGVIFGLVSIMSVREYGNTGFAESLLKIISRRVELELERRDYEEKLKQRNEELSSELEAANQRYKFIVDATNEGVWEQNLETGEIFCNERFYEQSGVDPGRGALIFEDYMARVHPDDREKLEKTILEGVEKRQPWTADYRMRDTSGEYRHFNVRGAALYDPEGKLLRTAGMVSDITERKNSELMLEFLNKASEELSLSLEFKPTLDRISKLIVPTLADWFSIDVLNPDGTLRRLLVAHKDPEKIQWAYKIQEEYPVDMDAPSGVPNVLRTGQPELYPHIPQELLRNAAKSEKHRKLIDEIGFRSVMVIPLTAKGRTFGAISFITTEESDRHYTQSDLRLAEDFARRVALAIENTRFYEEVQAEREKFRQLIEALPQMAWTCIADGTVDYLNRVWFEFTGAPPGGITPENWMSFLHPDDRELTVELWTASLRSGEIFEVENRWKNREGEYRWHLGRAKPIRNSEGAIILWVGTATDIHDQKMSEESLAEQKRTLELINQIGRTISAELDVGKIVQEVTDVTTEITKAEYGAFFYNIIGDKGESYTLYTLSGAPRSAFAHMPMPRNTEVFGPTFRGEGTIRSDDIRKDGRYGRNSPYFGMPKGHLPVVSYLAVPVTSNSGEVIGGLFFAHSKPCMFTEQAEKIAEGIASQAAIAMDNARLYKAARESEEHFRLLADALPQMVWSTRADGYHEYYNRIWYEYTGLSYEETKDKGWAEVLHPDDYERAWKVWTDSLQTGKKYEIEYRMRNAKGEYRWFLARALPLLDEKDEIRKWFGTCTDIQDQKMLAEELERRVQERTAELTEANQELERSNMDLEQFAYVASHDLKEPLRMISSYTQLLQKRYSDRMGKDADEFIHFIIEGAQRMHDLIADLLNYSRVGRMNSSESSVDMDEALNVALKNLAVPLETSKTILTRDTLPPVEAIPAYMVQLFQNLIGNAIKFSGGKTPEIHIGVQDRDTEWEFSIRDNGIGIEQEYMDRIFIIFQRLHTREEYPGTGIGLAICKKIVEYHGGRIWAESEPGKGTTFYFTLPK